MADSIITNSGRILMARLLKGDALDGITHLALGDGDGSFVDPAAPPNPTAAQTTLLHERCRKAAYRSAMLIEDAAGPLVVDDVHYREAEAGEYSNILGVFFSFATTEGNGFTIKEYGFFGGSVAYVDGVVDYATGGLYHDVNNPTGQVADLGILYEVRNIPDFIKTADTTLEFVLVVRI